jgi:hypothetical protein
MTPIGELVVKHNQCLKKAEAYRQLMEKQKQYCDEEYLEHYAQMMHINETHAEVYLRKLNEMTRRN